MNYLILKNKSGDITTYINTTYITVIKVERQTKDTIYSIHMLGTSGPFYTLTKEYLNPESNDLIEQFLTMKVNQKEIL